MPTPQFYVWYPGSLTTSGHLLPNSFDILLPPKPALQISAQVPTLCDAFLHSALSRLCSLTILNDTI